MYLQNNGLEKRRLRKCLKSPVSEHPSTSNMVRGTKHSGNLSHTTFAIFIDHWKAIGVEKVSLSDMQNFKNVYYHIDCR